MLKNIFCKIMSDEHQRQKMNSLENKSQIYKLFCENGYTKTYNEFETEMSAFLNSEDSKNLINNNFDELSDDMLEMIAGGVNTKQAVTAGIATLLTAFTIGTIGNQILSQSNTDTAPSASQSISSFSNDNNEHSNDNNAEQAKDDNSDANKPGGPQTMNNRRSPGRSKTMNNRRGPNRPGGRPAGGGIGNNNNHQGGPGSGGGIGNNNNNLLENSFDLDAAPLIFNQNENYQQELRNRVIILIDQLEVFLKVQHIVVWSDGGNDLLEQCKVLKDLLVNKAPVEEIQNFLSTYESIINNAIKNNDISSIEKMFKDIDDNDEDMAAPPPLSISIKDNNNDNKESQVKESKESKQPKDSIDSNINIKTQLEEYNSKLNKLDNRIQLLTLEIKSIEQEKHKINVDIKDQQKNINTFETELTNALKKEETEHLKNLKIFENNRDVSVKKATEANKPTHDLDKLYNDHVAMEKNAFKKRVAHTKEIYNLKINNANKNIQQLNYQLINLNTRQNKAKKELDTNLKLKNDYAQKIFQLKTIEEKQTQNLEDDDDLDAMLSSLNNK